MLNVYGIMNFLSQEANERLRLVKCEYILINDFDRKNFTTLPQALM